MVKKSVMTRHGIWTPHLKKQQRQMIRNTLKETLSLQQRHYQAIIEITRAVSELADLHTTLRRVMASLQTVISIDAFWVGLYDPVTNLVSYPILYDDGMYYEQEPTFITPDHVTVEVMTTRKSVLVNRTQAEIDEKNKQEYMVGDTNRVSASLLYAPLILDNTPIGLFSTQSYTLNSYTQATADFLVDVGYPIATALNNARNHEQQQRRLNQLATLYRIGQAVSELRDLKGTLQKIFEELGQLLSLDVFYILTYNPATDLLNYLMLYDDGQFFQRAPFHLSDMGYGKNVILEGADLLVNRTGEEIAQRQAEAINRIGNISRISASIMMVSFQIGDDLRGMISAQSYTLNAYNQESLSLLKNASLQIGVALHNARLYEKLQQELKERQSAEAEVRQLNAELEARVARRTAELSAINKDLESFTYSISHDLRAPLRAMNGYASVLKEDYGDVLDDEGHRVLQRITYNTTRMGQLVDDLLAFSRMGRKEIHLRQLDLNRLLQDVLTNLQADDQIGTAIIKIDPLPACIGDEALIRQVFINLIENALKYSSRKAQAEIKILAETNDDFAWIHIQDNGIGFDMAYVDKLFQVFQRLHADESYTGTGVGLALVHRIVTRLGGEVRAKGIPDSGATFSFSLPRHAE